MDRLSDGDLVARALADRRQFRLLYNRYAERLYWYAVARTGSASMADDVVSETVLAVYERLEQFDSDRGEFAAWLFAIARRKVADQQRFYRRLWRFASRHGPQLELEAADDLLARVIREEEQGLVYRALMRLSQTDQEIVALRFSADLSGPEIADILGISHAAARKRLSRALQRLETVLCDE